VNLLKEKVELKKQISELKHWYLHN
jgi:hypothetical protein